MNPAILILILLAGYQFAEVATCYNPGNTFLARLAFVDVVWLPPLGVWLAYRLSSPKRVWLRNTAIALFAGAGILTMLILRDPHFIAKSVCDVVVARYFSEQTLYLIYGGYYQFGLLILIFGTALGVSENSDPVLKKHMTDLHLGVLGFTLPSLVLILGLEQFGATTSIMCHLALVLAIFLWRIILRERQVTHVVS